MTANSLRINLSARLDRQGLQDSAGTGLAGTKGYRGNRKIV